ncbi:MAG: TolC family protein [Clostridiales bacterium]|nr:TolC family protein [Clostridiales bacterium]
MKSLFRWGTISAALLVSFSVSVLLPTVPAGMVAWAEEDGMETGSEETAEDGSMETAEDNRAETEDEDNREIAVSGSYQAVDGNQIPAERLNDSIIDYDELGSLVHYYNTSIQELTDSTERTRADYTRIWETLKEERDSARRKKLDAQDDDEMEDYAEYSGYQSVYSAAVESYEKMLYRLDGYSSNKSRLSQEKQLTGTAQSLMISYWVAAAQAEYADRSEALYQSIYQDTVAKQSAGLATDQDVLTAYNNWLSMSASAESASESADSAYKSLCLLLGVDEQGSMSIGAVPEIDENALNSYNLGTDTMQAMSNNEDLISERSSSTDSIASKNKKARTEEEYENKIRIGMSDLYENVQSAKTAYEAAKSGYQSASIGWNNAQNKYRMGMLSQSEYLEEEVKYLQKESAYQSSQLNLLQAMETYDWAVRGIMDLD